MRQRLEGESDSVMRSTHIAQVFQYLHKTRFEEVARQMPIREGVVAFVNQMRRQGFMVGVVSDSYFVAAEIVRRRIFADFAMAHTIQFDNEVCTGQIRINPAFLPPGRHGAAPTADAAVCKSHVLRRFLEDPATPPIDLSWVVGNDLNDLELMRLADRAFTLAPTSALLGREPSITVVPSFEALLAQIPRLHEPR